jgi:hypothetical protein
MITEFLTFEVFSPNSVDLPGPAKLASCSAIAGALLFVVHDLGPQFPVGFRNPSEPAHGKNGAEFRL